MQRRRFLALLGAGASSSVLSSALGAPTATDGFEQIDLQLAGDAGVAQRALLLVPSSLDAGQRHPAVVLLHGYGAAKRETDAIHKWRDAYGALRNYRRLQSPPVARIYDSVRFLGDRRIEQLNASLGREPFRGLVMICPVVPVPYFSHDAGQLFDAYTRWIASVLLPAARARAPIANDDRKIGLVGHSMGGHVAIEIFLRRPDLFGALSLVQPELQRNAGSRYARRIAQRMRDRGARPLQLMTSTRDLYRTETRRLHEELALRGVDHAFASPFGAHTSSWMREAGTLEALLFQDRALRGVVEPALDEETRLANRG